MVTRIASGSGSPVVPCALQQATYLLYCTVYISCVGNKTACYARCPFPKVPNPPPSPPPPQSLPFPQQVSQPSLPQHSLHEAHSPPPPRIVDLCSLFRGRALFKYPTLLSPLRK